ncbi:hypothetical protein CSKR_104318 [Clonorchis sinensis]|uniref:Apoptosis-antagonizing transcription factor C-terminal domain-containing protein n=1 Tax=Clonorchis sinensis TaxID=79923 RepID=A0A419QDC8_CLOSI|nr:hypothetical protein CSKR_104318 [Clonorchis sinensis]
MRTPGLNSPMVNDIGSNGPIAQSMALMHQSYRLLCGLLDRLRRYPDRPKRVVDVRASKGRVLRYLRLPKAVDFMSPDTTEYFSQTQRNNLFAQLRANKD